LAGPREAVSSPVVQVVMSVAGEDPGVVVAGLVAPGEPEVVAEDEPGGAVVEVAGAAGEGTLVPGAER
jgi:hypothetical protein